MTSTTVSFLYLISAVLFIFALRGLSHPRSARLGNILGIIGMVIAIFTTLMIKNVIGYFEIIAGILVGGAIGTLIALRIQMTALPQLVAAFHSLVGLAAVFVAAAAFYEPESFGIGTVGLISSSSLVEMSIGTFIGAITFSGSVLAFGKLQGAISGQVGARSCRGRGRRRRQSRSTRARFDWGRCEPVRRRWWRAIAPIQSAGSLEKEPLHRPMRTGPGAGRPWAPDPQGWH